MLSSGDGIAERSVRWEATFKGEVGVKPLTTASLYGCAWIRAYTVQNGC